MKFLGNAKRILGMDIHRDRSNGSLRLHQTPYAQNVLKRFNMFLSKSVSTPLGQQFKLSETQKPANEAKRSYMEKVPCANALGSIIYLMICTRPDLAYAINVVSKFMVDPRKAYWEALK